MRVVILGAGVIGLATAYYLVRDGHRVTIVDRNDGVALETSYANGAQLSYSYVAPLAGPDVLPKIPPWLLRRDSPLRFYPALDPHQWRWLTAFLLACNRRQNEATTRKLLALSFYSRRLMEKLDAEERIEFGHAMNGKLVVYSDRRGFDGARRLVDYQQSLGCEQEALDREACLALEPALAVAGSRLGGRVVGGIHTPSEAVGDCYRFCVGLEKRTLAAGADLRLSTDALRLAVRGHKVSHVETSAGSIAGDAFVVALGARTRFLMRGVGIRVPVYPLKGYSMTLPVTGIAPRVSITDFKRKIVYAPLATPEGPAVRVAGMADVAGYSRRPDPRRFLQLLREAQEALPETTDYTRPVESFQPWTGLRPTTPKGAPILGASPLANLYLNCGQGALGWTLGLGSGRVVADLVGGRTPEVPVEGFMLG